MSLRFLVGARGVREVKDLISRQVLAELATAGIDVASATYNIVGLPELHLAPTPPAHPTPEADPTTSHSS